MTHSYEEIRSAAFDIIAGREPTAYPPEQYEHLRLGIGEVLARREGRIPPGDHGARYPLDRQESEIFLEVFWDLFRQGVITLGLNDANREFPFIRPTQLGRKIAAGDSAYFFHDVSTYERAIQAEIPSIDGTTLLYLKEAMQAFRSGCILSTTVMLGVAAEHTFLLLLEEVDTSAKHRNTFATVAKERTILPKINKFKNILDQHSKDLPSAIKEDLDTNFAGILSVIRTFRNQAGHPTGKIVEREQAYVLLQLFIPYCKKLYQLMGHFK